MKIKSIKLPLLLSLCLAGYLYYANYYPQDDQVQLKSATITKLDREESSNKPRINTNKKVVKLQAVISGAAQYLVDALQPINVETLKDEWQSQFGCYSAIPDNTESCKHMYLTASSYEEAQWMQRHGYPSLANLKLLEDPANIKYLRELANKNKYAPAMALLAIQSFNDEEYHDASFMALKLKVNSSRRNTFPYRLRGESLLAENNLPFGLLELKVASILGDYKSKYLFNRYLHKYPNLAVKAADHANLYLGRIFGVPSGQFPHDERPNYMEGGG